MNSINNNMSIFLNFKLYSIIILSIIFSSPIMGQSEYKIFGHRGCRGLYPENTIVGFSKKAASKPDVPATVNTSEQFLYRSSAGTFGLIK